MTASIQKRFFRYVIPNIFGMMSISAYFLADTYFISKGVGPDGLTALNLVLPIYSLILGVGNMIAIGSATRFRILRAVGDEEANQYMHSFLPFCAAFRLSLSAPSFLKPWCGCSVPKAVSSRQASTIHRSFCGSPLFSCVITSVPLLCATMVRQPSP